MDHRFQIVDVFGKQDFSGNPLAVVFDADGMTADLMQRITRWLNLSETAFLLAPSASEADYRVRIFTLERELPFAGHPTLGSCHAWLTGGASRPKHESVFVQECGAGLISLQKNGSLLAFAAPALIRSGPVDEGTISEVAEALHLARSKIIDAQWADNGPGWVVVLLDSAEAVLALEPARSHSKRLEIGVVGPYRAGSETAFEIRAFFSDHHGALVEDPVTGSLNASTAQWLLGSGRAFAPYVASQGTRLGFSGRVHITQDETGQVWVSGRTQTLFSGVCTL